VDRYVNEGRCDDELDLTLMNVSEDENEGSALDISMDSSMDTSVCFTPSSMSPATSVSERAWVRVSKARVEMLVEQCDSYVMQAVIHRTEQVEVGEEVSCSGMVKKCEVETRVRESVSKVKLEKARVEVGEWRVHQVEKMQAEMIQVGEVTRVGEPTVVVSVPKPTVNQIVSLFSDHELGRFWPVREVLYGVVDTVEEVCELVEDVVCKVVECVFEEDMERLVGVGDVLRDLCGVVGTRLRRSSCRESTRCVGGCMW
jgi:hypothetical protein